MMKILQRPLIWTISLLIGLSACSKPSDLGRTLVEQDRSDIVFTDTFSLNISSVQRDSILSSNLSYLACGRYTDPIFGPLQSDIFMNFRLVSTNLAFDNSTFDSLVLSLAYDSVFHYGEVLDMPSTQTWEVLRLSENIEEGQDYYSNSDFSTSDVLASNVQFTPHVKDSVTVNGSRLAPQLRIPLSPALGQELLNPADPSIYNSNNDFKNFLKGIRIRATQGNSIIRFNPNSTQTKLTLHYTQEEEDENGNTVSVAKTYSFFADEDVETVSQYTHNYTGTPVLAQSTTDSFSYIQGFNGTNLRVEFPTVTSLENTIINKAELVLRGPVETDDKYPEPAQLWIVVRQADDSYLLIDDVSASLNSSAGFNTFGGGLLEKTQNGTAFVEYRMNLSSYFQDLILNNTLEKAIYVQVAFPSTRIDRSRIGNERSTFYKPELRLTYTKLN